MINKFQLVRNIGTFDSVVATAITPLGRLTLIHAENGRGKTTLAAILRSLATGDPISIIERRRLAAQNPPHVVIECAGGPPDAMFQNGVWNRTLPNMVIFDDVFVDENIYSGLTVEASHRAKLHELILGAQGVELNRQLQDLVNRVETHNGELRQRASEIPAAERGAISVDDFCALPANDHVAQEIQETQHRLAASREQDRIRNTPLFDLLALPAIDLDAIERLLQTDIPDLDSDAVARVRSHVATAGEGAEEWIGEGMRRQSERPPAVAGECVFCAQSLDGSPVMAHYLAFFSDSYRRLQFEISGMLSAIEQSHSGESAATFERAVRVMGERRQFWAQFAEIDHIEIDTASIVHMWRSARDLVGALLIRKRESPLNLVAVTDEVRMAVRIHEENRAAMEIRNQQLQQANRTVIALKQGIAAANPTVLESTLSRLHAVRARYTPTISTLCDAYLAEKRAKAVTEQSRDQKRTELEEYRTNIFSNYQEVINLYLERFNAGFRLDNVAPTNTRGGPASTYNVIINNTPVPVAGGIPQPGEHSFRNILSAGDRNTLALAFFFSSLEMDPNLVTKTVVIDDPVSSLDDHRSLTTVQEVRRLATRAAQVMVLSHSKTFLCHIWDGADKAARAALHVVRAGNGSTIEPWDVDQDSITEHDKRHAALREYLVNGGQNELEIAASIRPLLEAFLRVAYPENFPPGTLLGHFSRLCGERTGTPQQILNAQDLQELRNIVEYTNRFHHETNTALATEIINSGELNGFVTRTLAFARRL